MSRDLLFRLSRSPLLRRIFPSLLPVTLHRPAAAFFRYPFLLPHSSLRVWRPDDLGSGSETPSHNARNDPLHICLSGRDGIVRYETDSRAPQRLVFDLRTVASLAQLQGCIFRGIQPALKSLTPSSRIVVLASGGIAGSASSSPHLTTECMENGLAGLVRSVSKEIGGRGSCINMLVTPPSQSTVTGLSTAGNEATSTQDAAAAAAADAAWVSGPVGFFLLPDATYVTGQVIHLSARPSHSSHSSRGGTEEGGSLPPPPSGPLHLSGKVAIVTGAAQGIGQAITDRLIRDGARVLAVDRAFSAGGGGGQQQQRQQQQQQQCQQLNLDVTSPDASQILATWAEEAGGVDILVHNAGITRDKTLKNMVEGDWESVIGLNLKAILSMNAALGLHAPLDSDRDLLFHAAADSVGGRGVGCGAGGEQQSNTPSLPLPPSKILLKQGGRVLILSSINGIAGALGQANYAFSKGSLIGYVRALSQLEHLVGSGITINAIAPGFIETEMTARMPPLIRELGRRSNALKQGGEPADVAAVAAFLATPLAQAISGQTIRVCGGSIAGR